MIVYLSMLVSTEGVVPTDVKFGSKEGWSSKRILLISKTSSDSLPFLGVEVKLLVTSGHNSVLVPTVFIKNFV